MKPIGFARAAAIVFGKEIVDALRDRRTLLLTLFGSVISGPLILLLLFKLISTEIDRAEQLKLPVIGAERAPALIAYLERERVKIEPPPADYRAKIRSGEIEVVLEIDEKFAEDAGSGRAARVRLYYDESRQRTGTMTRAIRGLLRGYAGLWGDERLALRGIASDVGQPLAVDVVNLSTPQQSGSQTLTILAFYAVFATLLGGVASAADSTAGERERGTLPVILTAPVGAGSIIFGKWAAVAVLACSVLLLTLTGFYLTLQFGPVPRVGIPFVFGAREYGGFLLILIPLGCCFAAILTALGALGRTFKEAQTNSQILITVVALLPVVQMFQFGKEPDWLKWVPVNGHFHLLTQILRGDGIRATDWLASIALPLAIVIGALMLAARSLKARA
ncbi:MAG: ABC transporter permease [Betaproteobacteria bacterium]